MDPQRPPRNPSAMTSARARTSTAGPRRRRPSRRTFLVRRLIVLLIVAGVVGGLVVASKTLFGGDTSTAAEPETTTANVLDPSLTAPVIVPPIETAPEPSTTIAATTIPDAGRTPTGADPARVLLVGDSEAGGLAPFLGKALNASGVTTMTVDYKSSTGLVRPDYYDWPAHLMETVPAANPDIVVALFGGNDGQSFLNTSNKVESPEWRAEYGKRVGALMDFLSADGRTLVWVGVPNAEDPSLTANLGVQNEVVQDEVAKHPNVLFVDSWNHFTGIDGNFAPLVIDPRDGNYVAVRSETDGFHLNRVGEEILAQYVGDAVRTDLRARGAAI